MLAGARAGQYVIRPTFAFSAILRSGRNPQEDRMRTRRIMRLGRRAGLVISTTLMLSALDAPSARAQPANGAPSALLLKRLAEAVDGHRTGGTIYLVAELRPPHEVLGIFEREADARARVLTLGDTVVNSFGPYKTTRDPGMLQSWIARCVHYQSSMRPSYCDGRSALSLEDIDSVTITVRLKNGTSRVIPVPAGADAVFFTLSAIDKFAIPYYTHVMGVEEAARMRQRLVTELITP